MFHPTLSTEEADQVVRNAVALQLGRKFEAADITQPLVEAAVRFLEDYQGDFEYVLNMHRLLSNECDLKPGQWAGVLNCYAHALRQPQAPAGEPFPNGYYTVHLPDEKAITLRVKDHWMSDQEGTQVVSYLSGPDNTSHYTGFGFLRAGRYMPWLRAKDDELKRKAVEYLLSDGWRHAGVVYAMESGNCCFCNKMLTTDESIKRHYGPGCAKKYGLPWG
jgi:hypothetical protein